MPRYEYSEGTSNKFWEIELSGTAYTSKWGRIGGSMSSSTKSYGDAAAARKEYDKLVNEKVKKGYQLVGGAASKVAKPNGKAAKAPPKVAKPVAPSGPARNAELEKAIAANPDDADAYLVYADWMQGAGEVRGELVVLQHAGKTKEANALIRKYSAWFLGDFAKQKPPRFELEWQLGYIKSAKIGWSSFEGYDDDGDDEGAEDSESDDDEGGEAERCKNKLIAFLNLPSARFLQELHLGPVPGDDEMSLEGLAEAIEEVKPPCLRTLNLGHTGDWDISSTSTAMPDSKSIRGLRSLLLHAGHVGTGKIELPELRSFKVQTGGLDKGTLKNIATAKWPKLERLEIWFGDPSYGASGGVKDLAPILAATGLKQVKHLGLMNCPFADELVKSLIKSKILAQLATLDLSMGNLSDRGIDTMVKAKDAFQHLAELNLDDNALTDASKPKVKGLAKKVNYGSQDSPQRAVPRGDDNKWSRYVAVGE